MLTGSQPTPIPFVTISFIPFENAVSQTGDLLRLGVPKFLLFELKTCPK